MLTWFWWTMTLKVVELIETVFFVLRKKDNQVSFLHVYHHVGTLMIVWMGVKFAGGKIMNPLFIESLCCNHK